jgi:hypothetical protein
VEKAVKIVTPRRTKDKRVAKVIERRISSIAMHSAHIQFICTY